MYDLPGVSSTHDPTVVKINKFTDTLIDYASPGHYLVEVFPWMKYIPSSIAGWKMKAEKEFIEYSNVFGEMFNQVEDRIVCNPVLFSRPLSFSSVDRKKAMKGQALLGL